MFLYKLENILMTCYSCLDLWSILRFHRGICHLTPLSFCFQAKHTQEGSQTWGVNGETGALVDMKELGIWEPLAVKLQTYKTAVEVRRGGNFRASQYHLGEEDILPFMLGCLGGHHTPKWRACACLSSSLLEVG